MKTGETNRTFSFWNPIFAKLVMVKIGRLKMAARALLLLLHRDGISTSPVTLGWVLRLALAAGNQKQPEMNWDLTLERAWLPCCEEADLASWTREAIRGEPTRSKQQPAATTRHWEWVHRGTLQPYQSPSDCRYTNTSKETKTTGQTTGWWETVHSYFKPSNLWCSVTHQQINDHSFFL